MSVYVASVRQDIAGQGVLQELGHHSQEGHILAYKNTDEEIYQNIPPPLPYLPTSPVSGMDDRSSPSPPPPPPQYAEKLKVHFAGDYVYRDTMTKNDVYG